MYRNPSALLLVSFMLFATGRRRRTSGHSRRGLHFARILMSPVRDQREIKPRTGETSVGATKVALLVAAIFVAVPIAANADSVTYDFTGTVTSTTGLFYGSIATGTTVFGTYTINISNAVSNQSTLPVSTAAFWNADEGSGAIFGIPTPNSAYVFSSTANVGAYSYRTNPVPGAYASASYVTGNDASYMNAEEEQCPDAQDCTESNFSLSGSNVYSPSGLPVYSASLALAKGMIYSENAGNTSTVYYNVTSLTPVPIPTSAWLMAGGLGVLGTWVRKRRAA